MYNWKSQDRVRKMISQLLLKVKPFYYEIFQGFNSVNITGITRDVLFTDVKCQYL